MRKFVLDGQWGAMPLDDDAWRVERQNGQFADEVIFEMDGNYFRSAWEKFAEWVCGSGDFATLSFCKARLTIVRHATLPQAIQAKQTIDRCGCGIKWCSNVHFIIKIDSTDSRRAREDENLRELVRQGKAKIIGKVWQKE